MYLVYKMPKIFVSNQTLTSIQRSWLSYLINFLRLDVRLVGGSSKYEGTVEVTSDGSTWQTTCGVNLGYPDASVICRQLNFTGANRNIQDSPFGSSQPPSINLQCSTGGMMDLIEILLGFNNKLIGLICFFFDSLSPRSPNYVPGKRTRSSGDPLKLTYLTKRKQTGDRTFTVASSIEWNKLPLTLRQSPSIENFKKSLKTHLF